jgi:hypothetical protein
VGAECVCLNPVEGLVIKLAKGLVHRGHCCSDLGWGWGWLVEEGGREEGLWQGGSTACNVFIRCLASEQTYSGSHRCRAWHAVQGG